MILFSIVAAALLALALVLVVPGLLRGRVLLPIDKAPSLSRSNIAILREQLAQSDAELAEGAITAEQHRVSRAEIERRVLDEEAVGEATGKVGSAPRTAMVVAVCLPLFAIAVYAAKGNLAALDAQATPAGAQAAGAIAAAGIEETVDKLAQRLETQTEPRPDDARRWTMLGRSYAFLRRLPEAGRAYRRAVALAPDDAQLLADAADVLATLQGRKLDGEPMELVGRALRVDPDQPKALALAGTDAFERRDYGAAVDYWTRARRSLPAESELAKNLDGSIAEARAAGGGQAASVGAGEPTPAAAPRITGRVRLSPALASLASPGDTVFIYARALEGSRMPLAIIRRTVGDLPTLFTLDDSLAMGPQMKLSTFAAVIVGARVSKSGNAMPQPGDLQGQVAPVKLGAEGVELVIDAVRP